jgi:transcriptional regulator with XRE-family HTH domain
MRAGEIRLDRARRPRQNGSAIRDFRVKAGISRRILAERVRIKPATMANIENEYNGVSYELLYRLANALVVDIRSILRDPPPIGELDQLMYDEAREQAS